MACIWSVLYGVAQHLGVAGLRVLCVGGFQGPEDVIG